MSKKVHVTMSPDDYAALQAWIASDKANRQNQPHDPPKPQQPAKPQPQGGGIDGFTVFLMFVVSLIFGYWWLS